MNNKSTFLNYEVMKEEISPNNVFAMAEIIAFAETRYLISYMGTQMQKTYIDLYKDILNKNDVTRALSDGYDLVQECALCLCERVVIAVGHNIDKGHAGDIAGRVRRIADVFLDEPRVSVSEYTGLTVDFARRIGADFMVRGVRTVADYEYERNLADVNLAISGIETVFIPALPQLSFVSSSMVRELQANGHNVSQYLPSPASGINQL